MDTIGTSVKFGKFGLTGRNSKVDTAAEMRNQGIAKDVAPGRLAATCETCLHKLPQLCLSRLISSAQRMDEPDEDCVYNWRSGQDL